MKQFANRRTILLAVGTAALAAGAAASRPDAIDVTIEFENGTFIPKGNLVLYLNGGDARSDGRSSAMRVNIKSNGGSKRLQVSLQKAPAAGTSAPRQLVAQLQREDGWLLARGSTQLDAGMPPTITLYAVMY